MDPEVKMAFELAYLPIVHKRQRLNGGDFLGVAIKLMDEFRKQVSDEKILKTAAETMVLTFNSMLDPQMPIDQITSFIDSVYKPGPLTRQVAEACYAENMRLLGK